MVAGKGKGNGKGGGKGGGGDANTKRLEEKLRKADAEIRKLKADKVDDDVVVSDDEEMDEVPNTKEDWERVVADAEEDCKHA